MFLKKLTSKDPYSLILTNQSTRLESHLEGDNTWEIQYDGGELGGLSLYSTLGMQVLSLRITPIFSSLNENKISLKQFYEEPVITGILPNYLSISANVFPQINYHLEYFLSSSDSIDGQILIKNSSKEVFQGEIQFVVSLKSLTGIEQMKGVQSDTLYYLSGELKEIFPNFFLSGKVQPGKLGQSSISSPISISSNAEQVLKWRFVFNVEKNKTLQNIQNFQEFEFDKEVARNQLYFQKDFFFFETGNPEWDQALHMSQKSTRQLIFHSKDEGECLVQSRHPEKTVFQKSISKNNYSEGISPLQLWYFILALPNQQPYLKEIFSKLIDNQREDGFIPNHINSSIFLSRYHAFPILASIACELLGSQTNQDEVETYLKKLVSYLQYWFENLTENGSPHWENALQSLYEDLPVHNIWENENIGISSQWIDSPFLNSLLIKELEKCIDLATKFNIIFPEQEWILNKKETLLKSLAESWNSKSQIYMYRDIVTKKSGKKVRIFKAQETGTHPLEKVFKFPQRLQLQLVVEPEKSRNILIEVNGFHEDQEILEIINSRNINWSSTTGIYTTKNVFEKITIINIIQLPPGNKVEVFTPDFSQIDLTSLSPIMLNSLDEKRTQQLVDKWIHHEFLGRYGLRMVPKKNQIRENKFLNFIDLPLNSMFLIELIEKNQIDLALSIFSKMMNVIIKNLRLSKKFYKLYEADDGTCTGEYNIINGMIPMKIFFDLLGIHHWNEVEIEFSGPSMFKDDVKVYFRGMSIICSQKGHKVITTGGKVIEIDNKNAQKIKIPS